MSRSRSAEKTVVITGASSGIGRATAELLASQGWHVFGSVRSARDADQLVESIRGRFTPLIFDLRDASAIAVAADQVSKMLNGGRLSALVNNAGIANFGPLALQPIDDWVAQIDINLVGTLRVVQALLPLLGSDPSRTGPVGRIVNVSSVSGRIALPFVSGYAASKHGLEALSDAMRRELAIYGIKTIVIQPGAVRTPIWEKIGRTDGSRYVGSDYEQLFESFQASFMAAGRAADLAESFAQLILDALTATRPRSRYAKVRNSFLHWTLPRVMPDWLTDRLLISLFASPKAQARRQVEQSDT